MVDSFYKNITFALTLFWVGYPFLPHRITLIHSVFLVQRLLGSNRFRRMVNVILQRHLHYPPSISHWDL